MSSDKSMASMHSTYSNEWLSSTLSSGIEPIRNVLQTYRAPAYETANDLSWITVNEPLNCGQITVIPDQLDCEMCCDLLKVAPQQRAVAPTVLDLQHCFDTWPLQLTNASPVVSQRIICSSPPTAQHAPRDAQYRWSGVTLHLYRFRLCLLKKPPDLPVASPSNSITIK